MAGKVTFYLFLIICKKGPKHFLVIKYNQPVYDGKRYLVAKKGQFMVQPQKSVGPINHGWVKQFLTILTLFTPGYFWSLYLPGGSI